MLEYPNVNQKLELMVKYDAKRIILEDGSKWETVPVAKSNGIGFWAEGVSVLVTSGRQTTYLLKNLDENDTVRGFFLGFEKMERKA